MAALLGDVLLVLLADRGGTTHEIQRRHATTFGDAESVDISRISWTLTRQERLGLVRSAASPTHARQRRFELTDAGARRQRMWLLRVPPDATPDDISTRALLAIEAVDRSTFDMVISVCLTHLELTRLRTAPTTPDAPISAETARAELTDATLAAEVAWLQSLQSHPRERDRRSAAASG